MLFRVLIGVHKNSDISKKSSCSFSSPAGSPSRDPAESNELTLYLRGSQSKNAEHFLGRFFWFLFF